MCTNESILVKELKRQLKQSDEQISRLKNRIQYLQRTMKDMNESHEKEVEELKRENGVLAKTLKEI